MKTNFKKRTIPVVVTAIFVSAVFSGCFGDWKEETNLTISLLGNGNARALTGFNGTVEPADLEWEILLVNNQAGERITAAINSAGTHASVTGIKPGNWDIVVNATIFNGFPYAYGEVTSFKVNPGQNSISVPMGRLANTVALSLADGATYILGTGNFDDSLLEITVWNFTGSPVSASAVEASFQYDYFKAEVPSDIEPDGSGVIKITRNKPGGGGVSGEDYIDRLNLKVNDTHVATINIASMIDVVFIDAKPFSIGHNDFGAEAGVFQFAARFSHNYTGFTGGFLMGVTLVTQKQWTTVMGTDNESYRMVAQGEGSKGDNYPMYYVSWFDAIAFCNRLSMMEGLLPVYHIGGLTDPDDWGNVNWNNLVGSWGYWTTNNAGGNGYRLPSEEQWEFACRTGETGLWSFGNTFDGNYAWYKGNSGGKMPEVRRKKPNDWGLYDMHGLIWEWCYYVYDGYGTGNMWTPNASNTRTVRGGDYKSDPIFTSSAMRDARQPYPGRDGTVGFRVIR